MTELEKPNDWSIGKKLMVGGHTYDDLDELIVKFVEEIVSYADQVFQYRKFKVIQTFAFPTLTFQDMEQTEVEDLLRAEKLQNPGAIPYYIIVSKEYLGRFTLCYLKGSSKVSVEV